MRLLLLFPFFGGSSELSFHLPRAVAMADNRDAFLASVRRRTADVLDISARVVAAIDALLIFSGRRSGRAPLLGGLGLIERNCEAAALCDLAENKSLSVQRK